MHMHGRHQWDWYQPVTKADENGGHGGCYLHSPGDWAVIGLESQNSVCGHHSDCMLQFSQKKVGAAGM